MTFVEKMRKLTTSLQYGDVARIAKQAGVSEPTLRKALRRNDALELTPKEQKAIEACVNDSIVKERIQRIAKLENKVEGLFN